jgi:glucose/arabinose dehydrogenase
MEKICLVAIALLVSASSCGKKQGSTPESVSPPQSQVTIQHSILTQNLTQPWEIFGERQFYLDDGTRRKNKQGQPTNRAVQVDTYCCRCASEWRGGLLGMALHPSFSANPFVYVSYNYNNNGYKEKVVRFTYNGSTLTAPLVLIDNIAAASIHNGSRLLIAGR